MTLRLKSKDINVCQDVANFYETVVLTKCNTCCCEISVSKQHITSAFLAYSASRHCQRIVNAPFYLPIHCSVCFSHGLLNWFSKIFVVEGARNINLLDDNRDGVQEIWRWRHLSCCLLCCCFTFSPTLLL